MEKQIIKTNRAGIYIHIPFCLSKCDYCDFISFACNKNTNKTPYINALIADIIAKSKTHNLAIVDTIYFGGGTPSILEICEIQSILTAVLENYNTSENAEITIEVNPKTVDKSKLEAIKNMGFNRVSVGVQSFEDAELSAVSRAHTGEEACEVLALVGEIFADFSCDLMLGLPNSTMKSVFSNVKKALSFCPTHISLYGLQVEANTPLFHKVENGLQIPREDTLADMFELCENILRDSGYSHYEISNFAKEGFESKHNLGYWKLKDYIGVGVSAHSLVGMQRFFAPNSIQEYITAVENQTCEITEEILTVEEGKKEFIMLGFRLKDGVQLEEYQNMFDSNFLEDYKEQILALSQYLEITKTHVKIPEKYFYISNQIISKFT